MFFLGPASSPNRMATTKDPEASKDAETMKEIEALDGGRRPQGSDGAR